MSSQYYFAPYNHNLFYTKFSTVYGIYDGNTNPSPYFYATQDVPVGDYSPSGFYRFNITAYSRNEDVTTLTYSHTGGLPFAAGSIIKVSGVSANTTVNFTGMVLNGGSGSLSFVNPGWSQAQSCGGAIECLSPGWTTGFFFQPTYSTKIGTQTNAVSTQLGDGYQQRQPMGVNTFTQSWNLVYQNRGKREMQAIQNFVEDHAGAYSFEMLIPDQALTNQPNQKYVAASAEVTPVSFGLYDITVPVTRVFDL